MRGPWATWLMKHTRSVRTQRNNVFRSGLVPRAACRLKNSGLASVLGRRCVSVRMIVLRNLGCCFLDECACGGCLGVAEALLHFIESRRLASRLFNFSRFFVLSFRCSVGYRSRGHVHGSLSLFYWYSFGSVNCLLV